MDKNEALMPGRAAKLDANSGILPESGRGGSVRGASGHLHGFSRRGSAFASARADAFVCTFSCALACNSDPLRRWRYHTRL
ncbi:hypothetical protein CJU94_12545 [Paraburkholderia aromaticivorans]|uniref:Uncharacterized protein n=1 Tax=Paraburkholderia aromaticivorans TaxID=2026199 RepID=A0A248VIV7_9BURK|nr:hypothetical protein CJU94_12545 [Paraburkholderia aromaticivorans]